MILPLIESMCNFNLHIVRLCLVTGNLEFKRQEIRLISQLLHVRVVKTSPSLHGAVVVVIVW
jgi:hypothetical protein